jgi:hypothetical protein
MVQSMEVREAATAQYFSRCCDLFRGTRGPFTQESSLGDLPVLESDVHRVKKQQTKSPSFRSLAAGGDSRSQTYKQPHTPISFWDL